MRRNSEAITLSFVFHAGLLAGLSLLPSLHRRDARPEVASLNVEIGFSAVDSTSSPNRTLKVPTPTKPSSSPLEIPRIASETVRVLVEIETPEILQRTIQSSSQSEAAVESASSAATEMRNASGSRTPTLPQQLPANPAPAYPRASWLQGHAGVVRLLVTVGVDGRVVEAVVTESSGFPDLDRSARETVRNVWKFEPAKWEGQAIESQIVVPIRFQIRK